MAQFDSQIPKSFVRNFLESNPAYRTGQNEETDALFNPTISAKPLHVPMAGQIKKRLNSEKEFFWAFDRNGQSPYHERIDRLRAVGFEFASTKDVEMYVESTVQGRDVNGFSNEIRNGDLRLMKVDKRRWLEIRKSHLLQAIMMSNPRGKAMSDDGAVMSAQSLIPGVKTTATEYAEVGDIRAKAIVSDAAKDLADGEMRGNASTVSKEQMNKGAKITPTERR